MKKKLNEIVHAIEIQNLPCTLVPKKNVSMYVKNTCWYARVLRNLKIKFMIYELEGKRAVYS